MCGIVYHKSLNGKPANRTVYKRYIKQRSRGTDGFGFYTPETNRLTHNTREGRILSLLRRNKKATEILFHHRMPTSTLNVRNACHPFSTKEYFEHNYVIVHNGVVWNEEELRAEHEQRGIDYISEQDDGSFNDSEALAYDIARYIEGEVPKLTAEGTIAFIAIQREHTGKVLATYFGRNTGNPLMMKKTKKSLTLSSEGEGEMIDPNTLYRFDHETGALERSPCYIPSYSTGSTSNAWWHREDDLESQEIYNWHADITNGDDGGDSGYFADDKYGGAIKTYIIAEATRLMDESYHNTPFAIYNGKLELARIRKEEEELKPQVLGPSVESDDLVDMYYRLGDKAYYLQMAILHLEKGVSGNNRIGFRTTTDPHDYLNREPRLDPVSDRLIYPYAE